MEEGVDDDRSKVSEPCIPEIDGSVMSNKLLVFGWEMFIEIGWKVLHVKLVLVVRFEIVITGN